MGEDQIAANGSYSSNREVFEIPAVCFRKGLKGANFTNQFRNVSSVCDINSALGFFDVDSAEYDILKELPYQVLIIFLYVVVILLGVLGNTLVFVTIIKTKQLWNATNIFIANLAVADVFVCIFDLPLSLYYQMKGDWVFGRALCYVIPSAFAVVVFASTLTLTLIAIDRFLLIMFPQKNRLTNQTVLLLVIAIAIISLSAAAPIARYSNYLIYSDVNFGLHRRFCVEKWPSPLARQLYTCTMLAVQFVFPLFLINILYVLIFIRLKGRMTQGGKRCKKTKTTKMLVAVVTVFAIAWTPFHTFSIISDFKPDILPGRYFRFIDVFLKVVAMSSSCINPFLYGWLNDNYRKAFLSIIRRSNGQPKSVHHKEFDRSSRHKSPFLHAKRKTEVSAPEPGQEALHLDPVPSSHTSNTPFKLANYVRCKDRTAQ